MFKLHRPTLLALAAAGFGLVLGATTRADEIVGKVKSVDVEGQKVVIQADGEADKETEVAVNGSTSWIKSKKGKTSKKFELADLKVGSEVEVTRGEGNLASKVVLKGAKKKKAKAK